MPQQDSVMIKTSGKDLVLILDQEPSFEQLIRSLCEKFYGSRKLLGKRKMLLTIRGRKLTDEELRILIEAIELNSQVRISLVIDEDEIRQAAALRQARDFLRTNLYRDATIIPRGVKGRRDLKIDGSVVVMGDIRRNARVRATGNIIILGTLSGTAQAGFPGNSFCFIAANALDSPRLVSVGQVAAEPSMDARWEKRLRRDRLIPMILAVHEKQLLCEPMTSGIVDQVTGKWDD